MHLLALNSDTILQICLYAGMMNIMKLLQIFHVSTINDVILWKVALFVDFDIVLHFSN